MNIPYLTARPGRAKRQILVLTALLFSALNGFPAIPSPEKLLPDDTLVMMTVPDYAKMRELNKTSPQMMFWNDPAMKPFRDKFMTKLKEELLQPLERDLGVRFDDYSTLPQGQVTFAITQNGWQGSDDPLPAALLLLDAREKSGQLKTNLASLRKKWVDAGKTLKTEKVRNHEFWVLSLSTNDIPKALKTFLPESESNEEAEESAAKKPAFKIELVIGQVDSLLIAGSSTKAVETVVAHLTGGTMPALGDSPDFEASRLALFRNAPFYGWGNVKAFVAPLIAKPADKEEEANPFAMFSPDKIIAATGLNCLKTVAFSVQSTSEGSGFQLFVGAPEAGRRGIVKMLVGDAKESGPTAFVPADVVKFQRCRLDGQKIWAEFQSMLNDISPQLMGYLNNALDMANSTAKEKDPDFDIKKNLIGNLGDDLIIYEKAPRGKTLAEMVSAPSLILIGSPRAEQFAAAFKSVLALSNPMAGAPKEREFLGRKIYSVTLPAMPMPSSSGGPGNRIFSYSASGGYVAITTDTVMLEEYLRGSEGQRKTLRDAPGLADATAKVGGANAILFGYENQVETMRAALETLRLTFADTNGSNSELTGPFAEPFGNAGGFKDWVDFSLLPPYEKIAKFFYISVYNATANADGLTIKAYAPTPPALKK